MPSTATSAPAVDPLHETLPAFLLVVLFAFQVRFPPLSYPALGQLILVILAALILLSAVRLIRVKPRTMAIPTLFARHSALLPGILFIVWTLVRWLYDGAPADGAATVGTTFWAAAYLLTTLLLINGQCLAGKTDNDLPNTITPALPRYLLYGICLTGLVCGIYAVAQYGWLYRQSYDALLISIGDRTPDRSEAALLHHLNLRRVASFWGDPNSYAAFAALAFAASMEVFSLKSKRRIIWQGLAAVSMVSGIAGLYYTGSRGGVLDLLIVLSLYACLTFLNWRRCRNPSCLLILVIFPALLITPAAPLNAQSASAHMPSTTLQANSASATDSTDTEPGWVWRSDTIRERIYYLEVGVKMIEMAPVTGLGPGSVNDYFGRLKNPNAREARHLHNWPVNIWAEFGLIGLGLLLWFMGAMTYAIARARLWEQPIYRYFGVAFIILIFDGLLQTSWSQRELMCLFGATCGIIISATSNADLITRAVKIRRLSAAIATAVALLILEVPYLTAASARQIASDAMLANQPTAALKYWEKASQWAPRDPAPYQARAQMAVAAGHLSAANLLLNKALKLTPESAALHSEAANLAILLNQPDRAEKLLQRCLELYPSHPQYNLQYAHFLQSEGQVDKAISYARRALNYSYEPEESAKIKAFLSQLYAQQNTLPQ